MTDFLYTLIIFPIVQILELVFAVSQRILKNTGLSIVVISGAVSALCLPLYTVAEKWQGLERAKAQRMKPKIDKIRAVFSGDERFMILNTYYRQEHYHPLYALRGTFGVVFQIPFFIAAYDWLSHLEVLKGVSFLFITDLGKPDSIIQLPGGAAGNILPVIMTAINCIAGAVYTRGFPLKEKAQLYGIAALFLVLLYNSPAGLVLYWTCNNIFSLVKNILLKIKNPRKLVYGSLFIVIVVLDIFFLFFQRGDLPNRLAAVFVVSLTALIPFIPAAAHKVFRSEDALRFRSYLLSCGILFLLLGVFIPASVIASSVEEFSFIDSFTTPFPLLGTGAVQAAGIFLFWALILYALFPALVRKSLAFLALFAAVFSLVNVFFIQENFGFLTNTLAFSEIKPFGSDKRLALLSILLPLLTAAPVFFLWKRKKFRILEGAQGLVLAALLVVCTVTMIRISSGYARYMVKRDKAGGITENVYTFSKTGNNVLLIMLDAISGGYMPYIFDEKPELLSIFKDFIFYPNTLSYSKHTLIGALPLYGGYEYTPRAVNERRDVPLVEKQKEAYLLLPTLFADQGYAATITDPPFDNYQISNLSIFDDDTRIQTQNVIGKWTHIWRHNHPGIDAVKISDMLRLRFIRFSFFKAAPLVIRTILYDKGNWHLASTNINNITPVILDDYAFLDMLKDFTAVTESGNTYTAIYSPLTHESAYFQPPDYTIASPVRDKGSSFMSDDDNYHTIMATFGMLFRYFHYLKEEGVYDNTRIILVSDHGSRGGANYPENIVLPGGNRLSSFNPLLMVKDFGPEYGTGGEILTRSFEFMTNADVPLFAVEGLIPYPQNPWTGKTLQSDKAQGAEPVTISPLSTRRHTKYGYTILPHQWLYVQDTIFDINRWSIHRSKD